MAKGTPSFGKHSGPASHTICRRCGKHSYHKVHGECAHCGYGKTTKIRKYNWMAKHRAANGQKRRNARNEMFARRHHIKKH